MQEPNLRRSCLVDKVAKRGSLRLGRAAVDPDPITEDALRVCACMSDKTGRVVVFYPYSSVQMQVLAALEFLYQSNYVRSSRRQRVLVISDEAGSAWSYYLSLRVGDVPMSEFFGLSHGGKAEPEDVGKRSRGRKHEEKLFIVSSRRMAHLDRLPLPDFGALVLSSETGWNLARVTIALKIALRERIPDLVIIEPWSYVRKARAYNDLRFQIYGWTKTDLIRSSTTGSVHNYVEWGSVEGVLPHEILVERTILPRDWSTPYFESLQELVPRLFKISGLAVTGTTYGLYRDCLKLAVPLKLYDSECMGSFYRPPIAERLKILSDQISSIPSEVPSADYRKAEMTLKELVEGFSLQNNQKFEVIMRELR